MIGKSSARDAFADYYTEKLWALIPEVYRYEDGRGPARDTLRQLVEVIAGQAAETRRSIDRLWEDQHIETADDWAVPYIGDLVGTRLVSALDRRARRVDVANTVRHRRRRGTPDLLDSLARGLSGWDVVLVEGFRRLARTHHRLDAPPAPRGVFTATPPGGTADLRSPAGAELADGPFSEFYHTLDVRLLSGRDGRYGVRKLNFHLYPLRAYEMEGVDPVELAGGPGLLRTFSFDPSGRDVPLFINAEPPEDDLGALASDPPAVTPARQRGTAPYPWQVTQPMRCRLLGHDGFVVRSAHIAALAELPNPPLGVDSAALFQVLGLRFDSPAALHRRLTDFGAAIGSPTPDWFRALLGLALAEDTGKHALYPNAVSLAFGGDALAPQEIQAGDLANRELHPEPASDAVRALISPENGRFASVPPDDPADLSPFVLRYHYGFAGEVGAGPYVRTLAQTTTREASAGTVPDGGVLQGDGLTIADSRSYDLGIGSQTLADCTLQAASQTRPYVRLSGDTTPFGADIRPDAAGRTLRIDGGWYASSDTTGALGAGATADIVIANAPGAGAAFDFALIDIRHATLDPGGERGDGIPIPALRILVRAQVKRLVIRRSITGPIVVERDDPSDVARIEELVVCQSIVDARGSGGPAIDNPYGAVFLEQATVFGDVQAEVLHASDTLVAGTVEVVNNQAGCFRFSASAAGPGSRLPPRYRSVETVISPAFFKSRRFGDPGYAQLSIVAPRTIAQGAENGSEMGAFGHLLTPIRLSSIRTKVDEFGPVGMLAQYLFEGDEVASRVLFEALSPPPPVPPEVPPPDPGAVIPEPPPPPPPELPTTCPDDGGPTGPDGPGAGDDTPPGGDSDPDTLPGDDGGPTPQPVPGPDIIVIDLGDADLNGAPDTWRARDFGVRNPAADGLTGPSALERAIPFDRVEQMAEYDARFLRRPEDAGWRPVEGNGAGDPAAAFTLDERGLLRFSFAGDAAAMYESPRFDGNAVGESVHAYAVVALAVEPVGRADLTRPAFEIEATFSRRNAQARGLRAGWVGGREGLARFAYVSLDGTRTRAPASKEPVGQLEAAWHTIALQGDARSGQALTAIDGRLDNEPLSWFGVSRTPRQGPIAARFGAARGGGTVRGALRNIVVSAPGRFVRAFIRTATPVDDPVLRLGFLAPSARETTRARILVRYERASEGADVARIPTQEVAGTIDVPAGLGRLSELALLLKGIPAGAPILLTVERDHTHPDDRSPATVYLADARLFQRSPP